jgi:hypothetical protein
MSNKLKINKNAKVTITDDIDSEDEIQEVQELEDTKLAVIQEAKPDNKQNEKKRRNLSPDEICKNLKFTKSLEELTEKVNIHTQFLKDLKNELKKLEINYNQDINKVHKSKRKREPGTVPLGFVSEKLLSDGMAKLIHVEKGTKMSMPEYTKKFNSELRSRGLLYEKDKRVFRTDAEIRKVFGFEESINKSTDYKDKQGFNFATLQGHLSRLMKEKANKEKEKEILNVEDVKQKPKVNKVLTVSA